LERIDIKVKLSEIFVASTDKNIFSIKELSALSPQPDFIKKVAARFGLSFAQNAALEGNLCFAEKKEVRPEYRNTFSKADIMEIVLPQLFNSTINLEQEVVLFPEDVQSFFSESYKNLIAIKARKKHLRQSMLEQRDKMSRKERNTYSEKICEQLWELIIEKKIRVIHSYLTMGSEVNVLPLLQKALNNDIMVVVPKTLKKRQMQNLVLTDLKNMEAGIFNTYHPKDATEYTGNFDLIIVAGLAFDQSGFRVGYGGGYYDTFLADQDTAMKVGVCYPFQKMESIPLEEHDIQLNKVVC